MLRKDFTVSAYQLDQARLMGANAALLIVALLDAGTLEAYLQRCEELGLAALVETHNEEEIRLAISAGARIIGVNNRNLKDFSVDFGNAARLRDLIPADCIYVAESGVKTPSDIRQLRKIGADAVLIGEALMRAENPAEMLQALKG
jgi:indole-3-glycerol phosphate synthase